MSRVLKIVLFGGGIIVLLYWAAGQVSDGSLDESPYLWVCRVITDMIYLLISGVLLTFLNIIDLWHTKLKPPIRLGTFAFALLLLDWLRVKLQLRYWHLKVRRLALYCPTCEGLAQPMVGTFNRYRCRKNHQFDGDYHNL